MKSPYAVGLVLTLASSAAAVAAEPAIPSLTKATREAVIAAANQAIHQHMKSGQAAEGRAEIAKAFWGEAIERLKPLRVRDDRVNVFIVLAEDAAAEEGLYVSIPISSYAPGLDDRFVFFKALTQPGDKAFGSIFRCRLLKAGKAAGGKSVQVGLRVDVGGYRGTEAWPLGVGVPMPKGRLAPRHVRALAIVGKEQGRVPAAIEVRLKWDDGSVRWLWADFRGNPYDEYQLRGQDGDRPSPKEGVGISREEGAFRVSTGKLEVTFASDKATPVRVALPGASAINGDGLGAYVIDNTGRRAALGGVGAGVKWTVETENTERAVLRVEGSCVAEDGQPVADLVLRYDFRAGQPWFTVEHRLIVTEDTTKRWFREYGVTFPGRLAGATASFGVDGKSVEVPVGEGGAWLFQRDYPRWSISKTECAWGQADKQTGTGKAAEGWVLAKGSDSTLMLAVRDLAPRFPKELSVGPQGITAKLWSSRGGVELDYRPATLLEHFWGDELIEIVKSPEPDALREKIRGNTLDYPANAQGTARTHFLLCGYGSKGLAADQARQWHDAFQRPPVVLPDPAWSLATGIFPPLAPKDSEKFPKEEAYISTALDSFVARGEVFPLQGWYDFGVGPYWRLADKQGRLTPRFYRANYLEAYNTPKHVWLLWVRSGERKYLDFGELLNGSIADYRFCHYGRRKGFLTRGVRSCPLYWTAYDYFTLHPFGSADTLASLWVAALLRDDRHARDILRWFGGAINANFNDDYARGHDPDVRLQMILSAWHATQDPELLGKVRYIARGMANPNATMGLDPGFERRTDRVLYKYGRKLSYLLEYDQVAGPDPEVRRALDKGFDEMNYLRPSNWTLGRSKPHTYQNYLPLFYIYGYTRTGEVKYRKGATAVVAHAIRQYHKGDQVTEVTCFHQMFPWFVTPQILEMQSTPHRELADDPAEYRELLAYRGLPADRVFAVLGTWRFKLDPQNVGEQQGWWRSDHDDREWASIKARDFWERQGYGAGPKQDQIAGGYDGFAWYRREFAVPAGLRGRRIVLRFGAIDESGWVYVNGAKVAEMVYDLEKNPESYALPVVCDITDAIRFGQPNVVAVKVQDENGAGGLWRLVTVHWER